MGVCNSKIDKDLKPLSEEHVAGGIWSEYSNIDMCGKGDMDMIHNWKKNYTIKELKMRCEQKGYSAICVGSFDHAALKKFPFQLTPQHCRRSQGYSNRLYIFTPYDKKVGETIDYSGHKPFSMNNSQMGETLTNISTPKPFSLTGSQMGDTGTHKKSYAKEEETEYLVKRYKETELPEMPKYPSENSGIKIEHMNLEVGVPIDNRELMDYPSIPTNQKKGFWKKHHNIDMCGQGDIEMMMNWKSNYTIEQLKQIVEEKGYSAITVSAGNPSFNHAAIKDFPYDLRRDHCKQINQCCRHPSDIYIYTSDKPSKEEYYKE